VSDQKKPPVPSFEELQAAQRAREATTKGPAPQAPNPVPGQLDPRLTKTTPMAPNPALLNAAKPGQPSRLDPEMLARLATGGLASGAYPKGNLEPTQMGPMPKPPAPDERTFVQKVPTIPPAPAPPPKVGTPAGQPSSVPPQRAPSIPHAPASLSTRPPVVQGPPPKMPAPPPAGAAPVSRPPTQPPPPVATRPPANPAPPAPAKAPSIPPPAYAPRAPAPPNPPVSNTPASLRVPGNTPIPGSTISMRQPSNIPPAPSHSPTLARVPSTVGPAVPAPVTAPTAPVPRPLGAEPGSGMSATFLRPITGEAARPPDNLPELSEVRTELATNPTHKVSRAELQNMLADATTSPRQPAVPAPIAPVKSPQPKLDAAQPERSSSKSAVSESIDDRTPVYQPKPEPQRPIASTFASEPNVAMPHLDRPPALNSKSLLDVSPVLSTPALETPPMKRSETVNLRPPSKEDLPPVQPPKRVSEAKPLVDISPDERTPLKVNAAFATTQPGVPGPFAKKGPRATDMAVTPVEADAQPGELQPTTDVGGLEPVTVNQGPLRASALGEAYDPSANSGEVPAVDTQLRPGKELVAQPAGLIRRCIAFTIDFALVGGLCVGLLYLASVVKGVKKVPPNLSDLDILLYRAHALDKLLIPSLALCGLVVLVYATVFASALGGRTPGRLVTGVRLVTASGETPGPVRALLRAVFSFVSFGLCLSGFWLALFDRKGQTLHDKLTRTFVVRPL
jgi:uncharacterized RDD family membrane protein YckC